MKQHYDDYTAEDHEIWGILFERQHKNLQGYSCSEYLECLDELDDVLTPEKVVDFRELDEALSSRTGWTIEVVEGLIPVEQFFKLLARKKFSASTWLRSREQLDYLEEPDMFHDIFGHTPILINESFSRFAQKFGELGVRFIDHPTIVKQLQRIYWFTIEFGVMKDPQLGHKVYGAGIISSYGETNHVMEDEIDVRDYNIHDVIKTEFRTDVIQSLYYKIDHFDQLFESLVEIEQYYENQLIEQQW